MSSEERDLPASQQKLRKAREQGQVAHSADLNAAVVLIAAAVTLFVTMGGFLNDLRVLWSQPLDFSDAGRPGALRDLSTSLGALILHFLGPLFAVVIIAAIAAETIMKRGFILSFHPILPKFDTINPVNGFANLFSVRRLIELVKSMIKLVALGAAGTLVLVDAMKGLMWLPSCGMACIPDAWAALAKALCAAAFLIFAVNGLIDMKLQSWLYMRDQKMSKTEKKQEHKNQEQSPEIKQAMKKMGGGIVPIRECTIIIGDDAIAIALRFVEDETPAPICVVKASGAKAKSMLKEAGRAGVPIHPDPVFVETHFEAIEAMGYMPTESYGELAGIFKKYGLM